MNSICLRLLIMLDDVEAALEIETLNTIFDVRGQHDAHQHI